MALSETIMTTKTKVMELYIDWKTAEKKGNHIFKAYFRKAGHACGMNKKEDILFNFGLLKKDSPPLKSMQTESVWSVKMPLKIWKVQFRADTTCSKCLK